MKGWQSISCIRMILLDCCCGAMVGSDVCTGGGSV